MVTLRVVNLPERTETGLVTGSDQAVWALHSCNICSKSYTILKLGVDTKSLFDTWSGSEIATSRCDLDLCFTLLKYSFSI